MFQIYCLISSHRGQKWKIHDKLKKKLITKQQTRDDISLYCFKKFIEKYLFLHSKYKLSKKYADNNCSKRVDNFNLSNVVYIFLYSSHFDAQSINNFTNSKRFEFLFFVFNWFHCLFFFTLFLITSSMLKYWNVSSCLFCERENKYRRSISYDMSYRWYTHTHLATRFDQYF